MDATLRDAMVGLLERKRVLDEHRSTLHYDMGSNEQQQWLLDAMMALLLIELDRHKPE